MVARCDAVSRGGRLRYLLPLLALCSTGLNGCKRVSWLPPFGPTADPVDEVLCPPEGTFLTYGNFGKPYFTTWCTNCHSSQMLPAGGTDQGLDGRQGAPVGIDFDSYAKIVNHADRIQIVATGKDAAMPPAGGPSFKERKKLEEWLICGLPGGSVEPALACSVDRPMEGSVTLSSQADADVFCAQANATTGDLSITGALEVDCLCSVGGHLAIDGSGVVALQELRTVGDGIEVRQTEVSELHLPELLHVGQHWTVADNRDLRILSSDNVEDVGGTYLIEDNPLLADAWIPRMYTVGGDLIVQNNGAMSSVNLSRLQSVGGDLLLRDNNSFGTLFGEGYQLEHVGGDLVIASNPSLGDIYNFFVELADIGGDLELVDNDNSAFLYSFTRLEEIGGHLIISGNETLAEIQGFDHLADVVEEVSITDNPALVTLGGFRILTEVGSLTIAETALEEIDGFNDLVAVTTDGVSVVDNPDLGFLELFGNLQFITGDVEVRANPRLVILHAGFVLQQIDGSLVVEDNPLLDEIVVFPTVSAWNGSLILRNNDALITAAGVGPPLDVGADLVFDDNDSLVDVSTFHTVTGVSGDLQVTDNTALPTANADALRDAIGIGNIGGAVDISGNAP